MSIGVIGGADGPTSIYIASSNDWGYIAGAAVLIAGGIAAVLIWRKKRQAK